MKVQWTREDDTRWDYYRPANMHRMIAGIDADGRVTAWKHRIASTSIDGWFGDENKEGSEVGGAKEQPLAIPNIQIEYGYAESGVPRGWWRSVEHSFNAFAVESFIDEIAHELGKDPLAMRLELLEKGRTIPEEGDSVRDYPFETDRLRRVLELAAAKAGWGSPLPDGVGRGIAVHRSFLTYVAEVAEVSVTKNGDVKVHRVVCAIDCGTPVNPDGIEGQVESAVTYGLTAALGGKITLENGGIVEGNFDDYPLLYLSGAPKVEVHIVPSGELPTGTGEPPLPPIAPAVANAIFAATGRRVRRLPITRGDLVDA